jgi:seryl-tRNA(Sec) selenium transferase
VYDRMYRAAGATLVYRDTQQQLIEAISERTAVIAAMAMTERAPRPGVLTVAELAQIAKQAGVPLLVDCAGELPPARHLTQYLSQGADLVMVSGGKGIQGPGSTGIIAGRAALVEAAMMNASPNHMIGRGMKVSKEEMVGLAVAIEEYVRSDERASLSRCTGMARYIAHELEAIAGLTPKLRLNSKGFEDVELRWDRTILPLDERKVADDLLSGAPRIALMPTVPYAYAAPTIVTELMRPGEEVIVARTVREYFRRAHGQAGSSASPRRAQINVLS